MECSTETDAHSVGVGGEMLRDDEPARIDHPNKPRVARTVAWAGSTLPYLWLTTYNGLEDSITHSLCHTVAMFNMNSLWYSESMSTEERLAGARRKGQGQHSVLPARDIVERH